MTEQEKHKVGEWLKKQESKLKINPLYYFDLIELIHNYHKENKLAVQSNEITISKQSELLLAVICEYNKINTQKEIIEVEKWIEKWHCK